jgi:hypothetical protein
MEQAGISILEHLARKGDSPPLHIHETEDEIFHILEGECLVHVNGRESIGRSGDILIVQRGKPHTYRVETETARFLTITGGRDFERLVRAVGRPAEGEGLPERSGPPTPEQIAALETACKQFGVVFVGPPLTIK